jgi:hypothetical protein
MSADNTGLGLFDDAASAVGNFPSALRGYDRNAVDDYVRSLEGAVVASRQRTGELEHELGSLSEQLDEARQAASEVDYTNLGGRASEILRLAEEQARETINRAGVEAERHKEEARREADQLRQAAAREGNDLKSGGLAEIEQVRNRLEEDGRAQAQRTQAEVEALVAAARRQSEALQREAEHEAQSVRQQAYLDTEELRRTAEREAADLHQQVAVEREQAVVELRRMQEEASERTSAMLAEATRHHQESSDRLEADIAEAERIRNEAFAEAEKVKLTAIKDSEERVEAAKAQAAAITERTQSEFAWRKQELKRETELLGQRKQAVLNQLASLSALAQQTAQAFPDLEDLSDFNAEEGDRTILRPSDAAPALPATEEPREITNGHTNGDFDKGNAEPELDGDATISIPAVDSMPAGTAHLRTDRDES